MKGSPKILFIANIYSHHIYNFTKALKAYNPSIKLDIFNVSLSVKGEIPHEYLYENIYKPERNYPKILYKIPKIRGWIGLNDLEKLFASISVQKYDIINIHNVSTFSFHIRKYIDQMTENLVLTPFGSEILRIKRSKYDSYSKLFNSAPYITCIQTSLRSEILKFNVPESRIVDLVYGSDILDLLIGNSLIDKNIAKSNLNINNCYSIVCGYNGYKTQNHLQIIKALSKVKSQLPSNYLLLFPMTYGAPAGYIDKVRKCLKRYNINYLIIEEFLNSNDLMSLRLCADIFIHAQPTDNLSASILEYIFAGATMVNASWIRYPILERYIIPYYIFDSFDDLGSTVIRACNCGNLVDKQTKSYIKRFSRLNMIKNWSDFYCSLLYN